MSDAEQNEEQSQLDLAAILGAEPRFSSQLLTLYIPDRDRDNKEIGTQRQWVLEAADLLVHIGGGVTIMPPAEGGWLNDEKGEIVWERPIVVYTYIKPDQFRRYLDRLREFLHHMGHETNQGEVALEFDGEFYRITTFDES